MRHTPGPWAVGPADWLISQRHGMGYRNFPIHAPGGYDVAMVYSDEDDAEQEANVRLIAAAPELLAACKEALEYFLSTRHGRDWRQNGGTEHELLAEAIAKAEGRGE